MKKPIVSQYRASLGMLEHAIIHCPEDLWKDEANQNPYWLITYHALFYTHLYLQENLDAFTPWEKHVEGYNEMKYVKGIYFAKEELLDYLAFCRKEAIGNVALTDLKSSESGFHWLPFGKLELQFYNIRHIQHHVGQLYDRLRAVGIKGQWVGMGE